MQSFQLIIAGLFVIFSATHAHAQAGQFTPVAGDGSPFEQVHFFPKNGNKILVDGAWETIPHGVGVISGGVIGTFDDACIDKVCGRRLEPETLYRVYVFMDGDTMRMDFSEGGHIEDPTFGNQVHMEDRARSLVGMVFTSEDGRFIGEVDRQHTISWFNRGHTGLVNWIGQYGRQEVTSCTETPSLVGPVISFLTFGINETFPQAFTMPGIEFTGNVRNDTVGGSVEVQVAIRHHRTDNAFVPFSNLASHFQSSEHDVGNVHTVAVGGFGADEGLVEATIALSNGGTVGCASITSGTLWINSLWS